MGPPPASDANRSRSRPVLVLAPLLLLVLSGCTLGGSFSEGPCLRPTDTGCVETIIATGAYDFETQDTITGLPSTVGEQAAGKRQAVSFQVPIGAVRVDILTQVQFTNPTGQTPPTGPEGSANVTIHPASGTAQSWALTRSDSRLFSFDNPSTGKWELDILFTGSGRVTVTATALHAPAES